jgi:hypothetical protein
MLKEVGLGISFSIMLLLGLILMFYETSLTQLVFILGCMQFVLYGLLYIIIDYQLNEDNYIYDEEEYYG